MPRLDVDALATEVVSLVKGAIAPLQARVEKAEAQLAAIPPVLVDDVAPEDLAASFTGLLTKELDALSVSVARPLIQKRVVRDADGKIARVVEEPAA